MHLSRVSTGEKKPGGLFLDLCQPNLIHKYSFKYGDDGNPLLTPVEPWNT